MLKKLDYIILSIICLFLGIFIVSQLISVKEYKKVIQPENNAVLALEVSQLTKTNADLRREVKDLTASLELYKDGAQSNKTKYDQYLADSDRFNIINAVKSKTGQGVTITVDGKLNTAQVVDLVNAIKNIGAEVISINNRRLVLNTDMGQFSGMSKYEVNVLGNSSLLKSAIERKGGIIDQISSKDIKMTVRGIESIEIPAGTPVQLNYSRIVKD